jgi:L-lactate dehydrogenase complex protein LldG
MSDRNAILQRVREALRLSAPPPGHHAAASESSEAHEPHGASPEPFRAWLPEVGPGIEDWIALFAACSEGLKTRFLPCSSEAEAATRLSEIAREENWKRVASHRAPPAQSIAEAPGLPVLWTDDGYAPEAMERCDAGISACDALIAQTGGVLLTSRSGGGRALSVLPPHHVVVARRSQVVPDLPAAFALLEQRYGSAFPSMMTFITGPSRTGDIERILVLGAHGPRKLTVLLVP